MKLPPIFKIALLISLAHSVHGGEVRLNDLPVPIRTTIYNNAKGADVQRIVSSTSGGQPIYFVTVKAQNGGTASFNVGPNGKYLGNARLSQQGRNAR